MKPILLASQSPRRKELMNLLPWPYEVCVTPVEERLDFKLSVYENVEALADLKATATAKLHPDRLVVGADTVVCYNQQILGKPKDAHAAYEMIQMLSGKTHQVYTGVAIVHEASGFRLNFHEETSVSFKILSEVELTEYIETKERNASGQLFFPWEGKAGAYGIQDTFGARYISRIEGDYYNVVGLPVQALYTELSKILLRK